MGSSSHKVHKGKRSAEPEPAKYGHSTPSYNCETVYETVYEKQCKTKNVTLYMKKNVKPSTSKSAILNTRKSAIRSPLHMGMGLISPSANIFQWKNAKMFPKQNATMFPRMNAKMCPNK